MGPLRRFFCCIGTVGVAFFVVVAVAVLPTSIPSGCH